MRGAGIYETVVFSIACEGGREELPSVGCACSCTSEVTIDKNDTLQSEIISSICT